ncbi:hypothetical protein [Roseinatronobacter alkalisoli]|nr:hypothetical protein [Roseinatronobacter sp. HJB301]
MAQPKRALSCFAKILCFVAAIGSQTATADPATSFAANDVEFLNLMGNLEGPSGFGSISHFAPALPTRPLTEMTLAEVLDYQRDIRAMGTISSAVGRYQFIYLTMRDLVETHDISDALVFDPEVQTYLARFLMYQCGFYERSTPVSQLGNCLASVWAALPLVSGPLKGESAYSEDGINKAFVAPEIVIEVLRSRFEW